MEGRVVLDVGKTISKLTLWSGDGRLLAREDRANARAKGPGYAALDVDGIQLWLFQTLARFGRKAKIRAIIPVAHGASAAIVRNNELVLPPVDYENPIPADERRRYDAQRDRFSVTGSPALPDGLNLGAQLHHLETIQPGALDGAEILLWPQYWAWLLSGVAASEITSLGCHTDLWLPIEQRPSDLADVRGWGKKLPALRLASEALGPIRPAISASTGLPSDVLVYCGLHDSNAALIAARGFSEIGNFESTVLSTGTWFIAMRTPAPTTLVNPETLPEGRDCLVNIDAFGRPVASARFMGGREIETLTGIDTRRIDITPDQADLVAAVPTAISSGAMVLPTFAPAVGPFPNAHGRWVAMPAEQAARRAAVSLYAALVADVSLDLIGSCERILVEGRFAEAEVLVRGLAALRPDTAVYCANAHNDVSFGALRLLDPSLEPSSSLRLIEPLEADLHAYRSEWRELAEQMDVAA